MCTLFRALRVHNKDRILNAVLVVRLVVAVGQSPSRSSAAFFQSGLLYVAA
jgi:hypothetical protein